jgi:hypothetical protein
VLDPYSGSDGGYITEKHMPEKDPTSWSIATWALALAMSFFGSLISRYNKVRNKQDYVFNAVEFIAETFVGAFVGLGVFMLLAAMGQSEGICSAAAGVGGHMSMKLLYAIERLFLALIKKKEGE